MKLGRILATLLITTILGTGATFADVDKAFINRGGDEFISLNEISRLGIDYSKINEDIIINEDLKFGEKEMLKSGNLMYVPFKSVMEAANYEFEYTNKKTMVIKKGGEEKKYNVTPIKETYKIKKATTKVMTDKKEKKVEPKVQEAVKNNEVDMKYIVNEDKVYVNVLSLLQADIEMNFHDDEMIFKSNKNDNIYSMSMKAGLFGYENGKVVNRVPLIHVLEAFQLEYQQFDDKIVLELNGSTLVFHN